MKATLVVFMAFAVGPFTLQARADDLSMGGDPPEPRLFNCISAVARGDGVDVQSWCNQPLNLVYCDETPGSATSCSQKRFGKESLPHGRNITLAGDGVRYVACLEPKVPIGWNGQPAWNREHPGFSCAEPRAATTASLQAPNPAVEGSSGTRRSQAERTSRTQPDSSSEAPHNGAVGASGGGLDSAKRCISAEGPGAENNYSTTFTNSCGSKVWVTWFDEDACRRTACAVEVAPGQRKGVYRHKGELEWAACFSPARPKAVDGVSRWARGDYRCARAGKK